MGQKLENWNNEDLETEYHQKWQWRQINEGLKMNMARKIKKSQIIGQK